MHTISTKTLEMYVLIGVLTLTGIIVLPSTLTVFTNIITTLRLQREEARLKKTLAKELRFQVPGFRKLSQYAFHGSGKSESHADAFSDFGAHLVFTVVQTCTTEDMAQHVSNILQGRGFQATAPLRTNGNIHTILAKNRKGVFTVSLGNSLHHPNAFYLGLAKVPVQNKG